MSRQYKSADEVVALLRREDVEIASYNRDEGVLWLTIPVDDPVEDIVLDDFERGFVTAFCLEINDRVRAEYAELGHVDTEELPCDDWADRYCRVPPNEGSDGKMFDINYGFIEDNGSYRFWATAYPVVDCGEVTKTDGNSYVRIV
tara:strand:+ start:273 stop:707 length:435 start_codon:yes stop_codon:yes gene_type:complete